MRKSTVFIAVCAGAPLLALGFGAPTAWADPTTDSGNASVSVSVNGTEKVDKGPGVADSGNVGDHNVAVAINNSVALAGNGDNNHATAINNSLALAGNGDNNRATAINDSFAQAVFGDNNTATAVRGGCARATGGATVRSNGGSC